MLVARHYPAKPAALSPRRTHCRGQQRPNLIGSGQALGWRHSSTPHRMSTRVDSCAVPAGSRTPNTRTSLAMPDKTQLLDCVLSFNALDRDPSFVL